MDYDGSNQHQVTHVGRSHFLPDFSRRLPPGLQLAGQVELGDPDVLARPETALCRSPSWVGPIFRPPGRRTDEAGVFVFPWAGNRIFM